MRTNWKNSLTQKNKQLSSLDTYSHMMRYFSTRSATRRVGLHTRLGQIDGNAELRSSDKPSKQPHLNAGLPLARKLFFSTSSSPVERNVLTGYIRQSTREDDWKNVWLNVCRRFWGTHVRTYTQMQKAWDILYTFLHALLRRLRQNTVHYLMLPVCNWWRIPIFFFFFSLWFTCRYILLVS